MKFKNQTLFDEFEIDAETSQAQLLKMFQTKPNLRKVLPQYVKIINNKNELLAEKLFSKKRGENIYDLDFLNQHKDLSVLSPVEKNALCVAVVSNFETSISKYKFSAKVYNDLLNNLVNFDDFATEKITPELYQEFSECVLSELKKRVSKVLNAINSKDTNSLYRVVIGISDEKLKKELCDIFMDSISSSIELLNNVDDETAFENAMKYISSLNSSIYKNETFYRSYKATLNMLNKKLVAKGAILNKYFISLAKPLKKEDAVNLLKPLATVFIDFLSFNNIGKYDYKFLVSQQQSAQANYDYVIENNLHCDGDYAIKNFIDIVSQGEDWYDEYVDDIENINDTDSIFDLCSKIREVISNKEHRIILTNMLMDFSTFNKDFGDINIKIKNTEMILEDMKKDFRRPINYTTFCSTLDKKVITPGIVDSFTAKFYPIVLLDEQYKNLFENIKAACFMPLSLIEFVPEYGGYGYGLTPKGAWLLDMLKAFPEDWEIAGITVKSKLYDLRAYRSDYGESKSKDIVDKCNKIIKKKSATTQSTTTNSSRPYTQSSNSNNSSNSTSHPVAVGLGVASFIAMIGGFVAGIIPLGIISLVALIICIIVACQK